MRLFVLAVAQDLMRRPIVLRHVSAVALAHISRVQIKVLAPFVPPGNIHRLARVYVQAVAWEATQGHTQPYVPAAQWVTFKPLLVKVLA